MSEIEKLIHNPLSLFQLLSSKYSDITEEYESLYLDYIMYNKSSHYLSLFKEIPYMDFMDEYLKRYYQKTESIERIPYLADYYKNYHLFFCQPLFCNWKFTVLIHNRCDTKAELFYKKNYGNIKEEKVVEKNISRNDSFSTFDNVTNNKTIFDSFIRKRIDNNIATTMNFDIGETSQCIHGSQLYTKKSTNESLRNILSSLNVIKPDKKYIKKNSGLSLKSSLCTLIKTKVNSNQNLNENLNEYDKFLLSPKLRPFIGNYHSNLIEFNKGKQDSSNKIMTSLNNPKYSVVIPNLNHNQLVSKNKKGNKTYDLNSLSKNKNIQYAYTGINQQNINDNNTISQHCILSRNNSKSKSQKHTTINNGKAKPYNSTYTNFILNAKNKKINFVQSQRSSTIKNGAIAVNNIKINSMNLWNNYCLSNSNIFSNSNSKNNISNNNNQYNYNKYHPNSLQKNNIQLQVHYSDNISRNKKYDNRITTVRTKNTSNFQGITRFKPFNSIEDKKIKCFELKTIIKELVKDTNDQQTIQIGTKLNDLLKTGHTINWVKKKKQNDKDNHKCLYNNNDLHNLNSPKVIYLNKSKSPQKSKLNPPITKVVSQRRSKQNSQINNP